MVHRRKVSKLEAVQEATNELGYDQPEAHDVFKIYSNIVKGEPKMNIYQFKKFLKEYGLFGTESEFEVIFSSKGKSYVTYNEFLEILVEMSETTNP